MTDKEKIKVEIKRRIHETNNDVSIGAIESMTISRTLNSMISFIDSLPEEPISENLKKAANEYGMKCSKGENNYVCWWHRDGFKAGAKWQKANLWKPADGDDLPEINREVIVLTQPYPLDGTEYKVSFAHRPYKGKYIGKNLTTGNIETFENKTYDEGGWNQPNVKWWLDVDLPKAKEGKNYE